MNKLKINKTKSYEGLSQAQVQEKIKSKQLKVKNLTHFCEENAVLYKEEQRKLSEIEESQAINRRESRKITVAQKELDEVDCNILEIKEKISGITEVQIDEMMKYANPPQKVKNILEIVVFILTKEKHPKWEDLKSKIIKLDFVQDVIVFDWLELNEAMVSVLEKEYKVNSEWEPKKYYKASQACGPLAEWAFGGYKYSKILAKQGPLRGKLMSLKENRDSLAAQEKSVQLKLKELEGQNKVFIEKIDKLKAELRILNQMSNLPNYDEETPIDNDFQNKRVLVNGVEKERQGDISAYKPGLNSSVKNSDMDMNGGKTYTKSVYNNPVRSELKEFSNNGTNPFYKEDISYSRPKSVNTYTRTVNHSNEDNSYDPLSTNIFNKLLKNKYSNQSPLSQIAQTRTVKETPKLADDIITEQKSHYTFKEHGSDLKSIARSEFNLKKEGKKPVITNLNSHSESRLHYDRDQTTKESVSLTNGRKIEVNGRELYLIRVENGTNVYRYADELGK